MEMTNHSAAAADDDDDENPFEVFNNPPPVIPGDSLNGLTTPPVSVMEALSRAAPTPSASIMHVVSAASHGNIDDDGSAQSSSPARRVKAAVVREPCSGINVSHSTKSCEQLPLVLVQHPFATFVEAHRRLAAGAAAPSLTVIGAVVRRTDPKQKNGKNAYGVISLWNLRGPFPTASDEMSVLIAGSAFDAHYTKLSSGVVVALSGIQGMENRGDTSSAAPSSSTHFQTPKVSLDKNSNGSGSNTYKLLKVVKTEQVRFLGYAADLGTCQGIQQRSSERCNCVVNVALSNFCSRHISNLQREARGGGGDMPSRTTRPQASWKTSNTSTRTTPGTVHMNLALHKPSGGVTVSKTALESLARRPPGFLTVKGSCGLPTTTPAGSDVTSAAGAYAGVTPGGELPLTGMCRNVGSVFSSPQSLGITARGRTVLAAAVDQEDAKERQRLLQLALRPNGSAMKHSRGEGTSTTTTTTVKSAKIPKTVLAPTRTAAEEEVEEVRAQYAPLKSTHSSSSPSFAAMRCSGFDEVQLRQKDYQHHIVTKRANGTTSSIVSAVERHLRGADGPLAKAIASSRTQREETHAKGFSSSITATTTTSSFAPKSLLGTVAGSIESANDNLRTIDERRKFEQRMERRLMQDKAHEALEAVTEQTIKAIYCRQCDRWYLRRNERCKMLQHALETKETKRRFIECEHCGYKTSVIGDARPSKVIPRCPRCCADSVWRSSNAAPETSAKRKESPPCA